jgi:hypothetical protein
MEVVALASFTMVDRKQVTNQLLASHRCLDLEMPAGCEMESIFFANETGFSTQFSRLADIRPPLESAMPPVQLRPASRAGLMSMDAGRHRMAVVRPDSRGTAGESREHEDRTERGKKNGSHDVVILFA